MGYLKQIPQTMLFADKASPMEAKGRGWPPGANLSKIAIYPRNYLANGFHELAVTYPTIAHLGNAALAEGR
jgi:hypothetical protein